MLISTHTGNNHLHNTFSALRDSTASAAIKPAEQSDDAHSIEKDKDKTEVNKVPPFHSSATTTTVENELDQAELKQLRELRSRDREVRAHEQAHAAVAGALAKGSPSFSFQRGPDGQLYAIGGEVQIDTSAHAGDARATVQKAQQIRRAALAPAQPSSQDRAVAAQASAMEAKAQAILTKETAEEARTGQVKETANGEVAEEEDDDNSTQKLRETGGNCAVCGGHHSAESHVANVEERVLSMFKTGETTLLPGKLLNISA